MEKIKSFTINHDNHEVGVYVSSTRHNVITYDVRFKKPNNDNYLSTASAHTIEHLFATVIRNSPVKDDVIYFGPMGCRTGFYLLLYKIELEEAKKIIIDCFTKCLDMKEIPGSERIECGNYKDHNLNEAIEDIKEFLSQIK